MLTTSPTVPPVPAELRRSSVCVLVIHEEEVIHCGWRLVLSPLEWSQRCLAARDVETAISLAHRYAPDIAVIDLDHGVESAGATIRALRACQPDLRVLLLCQNTAVSPKLAQFLGAGGVVQKTLPAAELADAVLAVASGQRVFAAPAPKAVRGLSPREHEVLESMASGMTNREIAAELHLSGQTIKQHAASIYRKLGVRNRTEAARRGQELGLTFV